jgi:hypothetical protein
MGVVKAIGLGQLPGVHVPADAPKVKSDITPSHIQKMGVGIYRPVDKSVATVFYNPKQVPQSTLKTLDSKNKLATAFPSIMKFLNAGTPSGKEQSGVATPGKNTDEPGAAGPAGSSTGTPSTGAGMGQQGRNTPSISDLNLTGTPGPVPPAVPVMPRPGMGEGANQSLITKRANAIGNQPPSQQARPGAGSIVSGLFRAPV